MKQIILISLVGVLVSCNSKKADPTERKTKDKLVIFHVDDYSLSTDNNICYFDSTTARNMYMFLATQDEAIIKHAGIYSESLDQQIVTINVHRLDTQASSTNVYIAAKNKSVNEKATNEFQAKAAHDINRYISEIYKPRNAKYSDIDGICQLVATALSQPNFKDFDRYVIFSSDMRNHPFGKKECPIKKVHLPNTTILCIRPAISKDSLAAIFPESSIEVFADADIISFLKSKHQ